MSVKMLLGSENHVDREGVQITGGAWTIPLSALIDPRPGRKARSGNALKASTQFDVDLLAARALRIVALTHTNLSPSAVYRITWFSDAFSTPAGNTGWLAIPGYPEYDPDFLGASIWHVWPAAFSCRYLRVEIDDETNVAGRIEAGRLFIPDVWEPPYNYDNNSNSDDLLPNTPRSDSLGGVGYFNRRTPARTFKFSFGALDADEMAKVRRIRRMSNTDRQVVIIPDPTDTANFHERNFLATIRQPSAISLFGRHATTGFDLIEVVP